MLCMVLRKNDALDLFLRDEYIGSITISQKSQIKYIGLDINAIPELDVERQNANFRKHKKINISI